MYKDYLQRILKANVYDVARETPLQETPNLSRRLNANVLLKREDLQPVFSFTSWRLPYFPAECGRARGWCHRSIGRQPRTGCCAVRVQAGCAGHHCHAKNHPTHQSGGGAPVWC